MSVDRIVDANLNRAAEGIRVLEDICRFSLGNGPLQERCKSLRHGLHGLTPGGLSLGGSLLSGRDALSDVGSETVGKNERRRSSLADIAQANAKRAQEALRVLEETAKLTDADASRSFKRLRYRLYDLHRDVESLCRRRTLGPGLYLVMTLDAARYQPMAALAVEAGLPAVQLRHKGGSDRELLAIARAVRSVTAGTETLFIVNDRPDIAYGSSADGVHLGQDDLEPKAARRLLGERYVIGLSTHNLDQVRSSTGEWVDYIGFGPVYPTSTKEKADPVTGVEALADAAALAGRPVVAIGGLTLERILSLPPKASRNAAAVRAVTEAENPLAAMKAMNAALKERA